jgi:hypothetical protein
MSLVRYTNKKTGWVSVYESTSNYDPVEKKSKPKRRYIGYEDPVTHEFVPSSGKPGRKKKAEDQVDVISKESSQESSSASEIERMRTEIQDLKAQVRTLRKLLNDISVENSKITKLINSSN